MFTTRPEIQGTFGAVASTHWLASSSGMAMLERGGNAFDAAVAAGFVLQVVEPHQSGPAGDVPIVFHSARTGRVEVICGQAPAPAGATIEHYRSLGLDLIPGEVVRFQLEGQRQPDGSLYKVPQMGWNQVFQARPHPVWAGVSDGAYFYFVHSFYARPRQSEHSVGEADYGARFTAAVARDNIFATQFHPEKSADHGLQLYRNFLHWNP